MNGLEKFDREQLETWITMCDEKFDALKVPDNHSGALLSISGRLGTYVESNEATIDALRERVEALTWVVKRLEYIEEYPSEEKLCPICRGEKPTHYEDCELAAALQAP